MKAVIVQPAYLPYMGYFNLIDCADIFVYLDDVQFNRRAWQHRNRIKIPNGDFTWITVPVVKDHGQEIREVAIRDDENWQESHWKGIEHSYGGCEHFESYADDVRDVLCRDWNSLFDLDVTLLDTFQNLLGLHDTEFRYSSELDVTGQKTDLLIDILDSLGADEYISGPTAKDYIQREQFNEKGIELYWHEFDHPDYSQPHGEFVSHLTILDSLFSMGEETIELVRAGGNEALELDPVTAST